jgi:hypothetical protein
MVRRYWTVVTIIKNTAGRIWYQRFTGRFCPRSRFAVALAPPAVRMAYVSNSALLSLMNAVLCGVMWYWGIRAVCDDGYECGDDSILRKTSHRFSPCCRLSLTIESLAVVILRPTPELCYPTQQFECVRRETGRDEQ